MNTLEASAESLSALLVQAGQTFLTVLVDTQDVHPALQEKILLDAPSPEKLVERWLQTLLTLARDQHYLFLQFPSLKVHSQDGVWRLETLAIGELIDPQRHRFHQPLAGITIQSCSLREFEGLFLLRCEWSGG